jgi:hypothetical protein
MTKENNIEDGAEPKKSGDNSTVLEVGKEKNENVSPGPYRPEGLADHLYGKSDQETIDHLAKAYNGARTELSKGRPVPKTADDYALELPDDIKNVVDLTKDPLWAAMKPVFHKRGLSQEDVQDLAGELFKTSAAAHAAQIAKDDEELDFSYKAQGGADKAKPMIDGTTAWLVGLKSQGKIDDATVKELTALTGYGVGLQALVKLREGLGEKPLIPASMNGGSGGEALTETKLQEMMRDPKYWREKNPAFIDEVTKGFQKIYGK